MAGTLDSLFSTGGLVTRTSSTIANVPSLTGTLLTLTPPAGQRVRLNYLTMSTNNQGAISIRLAGTDVITSKEVGVASGNYTQAGNVFIIGVGNDGGILPAITGGKDEVLTIVKTNAGSLTQDMRYAYEFLE